MSDIDRVRIQIYECLPFHRAVCRLLPGRYCDVAGSFYIDAWVASGEYERYPDLFRDGQCVEFGGEEVPVRSGLGLGVPDVVCHVPLYSAEFRNVGEKHSGEFQHLGPVPIEEGIEKAAECLQDGILCGGPQDLWNMR